MIKKNGNNKYVMDYGAILQMVVIIGVIVSVFYHRIGKVEIMIVENRVNLKNCENRIGNAEDRITKVVDEFHQHEVNDR